MVNSLPGGAGTVGKARAEDAAPRHAAVERGLQEPDTSHPGAVAAGSFALDDTGHHVGDIVPAVGAEPAAIGRQVGV